MLIKKTDFPEAWFIFVPVHVAVSAAHHPGIKNQVAFNNS